MGFTTRRKLTTTIILTLLMLGILFAAAPSASAQGGDRDKAGQADSHHQKLRRVFRRLIVRP
jgi:hypothetical protein